MKHFKKALLFSFILLTLTACKSTDSKLYISALDEGQLVFLRPVSIKDKSFVLKDADFDITVKIINFELTDENTVNYTLHFPQSYFNKINDAEFFFSTDSEEKITVENKQILYKEFDSKKNLEVRFSANITADKIRKLLENPDAAKIGLSIDNQTKLFTSQDFSQKLFELGVILL